MFAKVELYWLGKRRDRILKEELTHKAIRYKALRTVLPFVS